jgi:hypothetical protein
MKEAEYQARLIKKIRSIFPGCTILKNDPASLQGVPDLSIFYRDRWAMLEVKVSADAKVRPNQEHHVAEFNEMSFAAFIYPENEKEVMRELQFAFGFGEQARLSEP